MEYARTATFPALMATVSDLYGASSYRMGEMQAYALDLNELDREEAALENMVQSLVERQAAVPIGVKFHRENCFQEETRRQMDTSLSGNGARNSLIAEGEEIWQEEDEEEEEDDEDDMDEDDMDEDDMDEDDMDEDEDDEEEDDDERHGAQEREVVDIFDSEGDSFVREDDSFAREGDSSREIIEIPTYE